MAAVSLPYSRAARGTVKRSGMVASSSVKSRSVPQYSRDMPLGSLK
jgi:hypothetical protein